MNTEVVGREQELASLRAFIERDEGGPAALVLEGEPGIGKSTLWLAGVEEAREDDRRPVPACRRDNANRRGSAAELRLATTEAPASAGVSPTGNGWRVGRGPPSNA
jgi:AAA ATPase domain